MKSTFSIIFYLKRQVVKKDGTVPVMGRITVDGTQAQFSCKTTANPNLWDTKGGRMIGKSMQALEVNRKLDKMRVSISKHYQEIMDSRLHEPPLQYTGQHRLFRQHGRIFGKMQYEDHGHHG